jgi:hypothetical protein
MDSLKALYRALKYDEKFLKDFPDAPAETKEIINKYIKLIKHDIRLRNSMPTAQEQRINIINDDDGYLRIERFDDTEENLNKIIDERYEEINERRASSPYDCTGEYFTNWIQVFKAGNTVTIATRISIDI